MKKIISILTITSLLSLSAFADSMYKSSETVTAPSSSTAPSTTLKEKQQRMEDDGSVKTRETIKSRTPRHMDKIKTESKKTSSELAE